MTAGSSSAVGAAPPNSHQPVAFTLVERAASQVPRELAAPSGPPGQDMCLGLMAAQVARYLQADDILLSLHDRDEPVELFLETNGRPNEALLCEMRVLASRAALSDQRLPGDALLAAGSRAGQMLAGCIQTAGGLFTVTSLFRNLSTALVPRCRKAFTSALPLMEPFFQLWSMRKGMSQRVAGLTAALDDSSVATFLTTRTSRIRFANRAGKNLLAAGAGLVARQETLAAASLKETLRLQAGIAHVCSGSGDKDGTAPVLAVKRQQSRPLLVTLSAAPALVGCAEREAVVCVYDPDQDIADLLAPACSVYGLSSRETALACQLAAGASLASAAARLGLTEQTARSYLKQVFFKTDTGRQAELVGLLLKSAVRTAHASHLRVF